MATATVIDRIELTRFEVEIANLKTDPAGLGITFSPGASGPQERLAVRIFTKDGAIGAYVPPRGRVKTVAGACEMLAHLLIGKDPLKREGHYRTLRTATKHVGEVGIGPLDIALWDLAGKIHDAPIAQLLGAAREKLPAYASTMGGDRHPKGLSSPEAYADFAEACLEKGYRAYKMHGWKEGDPHEEAAMLRVVAERVGDRMILMYDAACHLKTFHDAVRVGRVCDEYGYFWYEDPYKDGGISFQGQARLKQFVKTPLLTGEHIRNPETMTDMLIAGASDFARTDPDYDGGVTGCYKAAVAAETMGFDTEVHACGPAMRHLMAALPKANYYEVNLVHPGCPNAWSLPIYGDSYSDLLDCVDGDGNVSVPTGPGLGVSYDWTAIEAGQTARIVVS